MNSAKLIIAFLLVFVALTLLGASSASATNYFSAGNNAPNLTASWWTGTNGTGSHPSNFTTNGNVFIIQNGHTMTTTATWTVSGTGSTIQVNTGGTLVASNAVTATVMTVASGATYRHNQDGGTIPAATWNAASLCEITGQVGTTAPGGLTQLFGNFTWNSTGQTSSLSLAGAFTGIAGDMTITSTGGSGNLRLQNGGPGVNCDIAGNFSQSGGNFKVTGTGTTLTMTVHGSFALSGGTFDLSGGTGIGTLQVAGNFSISGTGLVTESAGGSGVVDFNGGGTTLYSNGASTTNITNIVNFTVTNNTILQMGTNIIAGAGTFDIASGATLGIGSGSGITTSGAAGNIQVSGIRTYASGANYIYNGSVIQAVGNGLTQNSPAGNLTIASTGTTGNDTVSLGAATTISGSLVMTSGVLNLKAFSATVGDVQGSANIANNTGASTYTLTTGSNNASTTYSGILSNASGTVALTKNGSGALTLSGPNTYSGTTTLSGGTLNINNATALGTGTFTIGGASTINNTSGGAITLSNNNAQNWNADFTFTGSNALNLGTGAVVLSANRQVTASASTLTVGGGITGATRTITKAGAGTLVLNGVVGTTTGTVTVSAGTMTLAGANTYSGTTTLNAGTLNINNATALGSGAFTIGGASTIDNTSGGAITLSNNNAQNWNADFTFTGSNALNLGTGAVVLSANRQVTASASTLTVGGGITGATRTITKAGAGTLVLNGVVGTTTGTVTVSAGTLTLAGANTYSGTTALNAGTLNINNATALGTGTFTIGGASTIDNTSGGAITLSSNNAQNWNADFTFTGSNALNLGTGAVVLGASRQVTASASTLTVGGGITGATRNLTKAGAGTLVLNGVIGTTSGNVAMNGGTLTLAGTNTYTGGTSISAGTLNINNSNALGTVAGTFTITGGTIDNTTAGSVTTLNYPQAWNADFTFTGTQNLNLGTGAVTMNASRQVTVGANTLTIGGGITGATRNLTKTGAGTLVLNGVIGTTSGNVAVNAGTLTLAGTNTYTGGTSLSAGTLNINNANALGTVAGTFTITGGAIDNTSGADITTLNYPLALNGDFTYNGSIPRNLNLGSGAVALSSDRQITVSAATGSSTLSIGGAISAGSISLTKAGAQTLAFGSQTISLKNLTVNLGTLTSTSGTMNLAGDFSNSGVFNGNGGTVNFNGSAAQAINGSSTTTFNALTDANTNEVLTLNSSANANGNLTVNSGAIINTVSSKTVGGTGTLTGNGTVQVTKTGGVSNFLNQYTITNKTLTNLTIEMLGAASQDLAATTFGGLKINNASGVTLSGDATVAGTLTLAAGNITTSGFKTILNPGAGVSRTSGHIVGDLQKNVATGAGVVRTFEVGTGGDYTPVSVTFANVGAAGDLVGRSTSGDHAEIATSGINASKSANRNWTLTNNGIGFDNYSAVFTFVPGDLDGSANTSNFIVGKYNAGWTYPTVGLKTSTSTQITGATSMSDFQLGEVQTYALTYTAGANGSVTGTTPQTVNHGADGTAVTAVPNANYHFVNWSDASTSNPRTDAAVTGNITVTANFAIDTYTLTYTAGANGSITGTTPQTVNHGADGSAVTAVPATGYHFVDWSDASTSNPRTDAGVTGNISVTANFAINAYTLSYTAGANGSVTGTTPQTVNHGADGTTVTAVPNANYHFVNWSDASTSNPRTDASVTGNITVTANFAIDTYTLTYTAGANGSITGTTPQTVNHGADGTAVTAVPNANYHFVNWSDASTSNPRTDAAVTGNISVTANFVIDTYTLTYTAGANGSITGTTPQTVNHSADGSAVTAVAAAGYHFVDWSDASTSNPRTDAGVTGNISVTANFAINSYTLTYTAGANGSVTGTTPQTVNHGSDGTAVTAVPNANYHFVDWSDASTSNPRTDANVSGNITVTANFAIDTYTLTYTAGANGSITGTTPQTVNHGANGSAVTAVPAAGYHFVDWSDASTSNPRTDAVVTGNISVTANFAINVYTLTYTAGANGSLTGTTPQSVNHGASGTAVTAVPNANYHFVDWSDASTSNPRTDAGVTGDVTVTANFAIDTYTLTYTPGANGSLTGTTPQTVNHGASGSAVTAVPSANYHFVDWSDASTSNPRTDAAVTGNISVTANFAIDTYTLTYTAGANGSLTGTTPQTVNHGADGTAVTAVPAVGYHFVDWSDASVSNPRTDAVVTGNISVTANFAINVYTLTYTAGANGSLTGTTPQSVNHGASGSAVTAVPAANYHFVDWSDASTSNPRTDATVTGNISVTANFAIDTYTLTYTAGANGSITGATPQTVNHGANGSAVTAVPAAGYHFVDWSDASTSNPRTDAVVTGNLSVTANFAINVYTLTYTAGANGSLTGTTPQSVNHGANGSAVTAVPAAGYHFVDWSDASTSNPRTDASVSANITVTANFAINEYTLTYTAGADGSVTGTTPQTVNHGSDGTAVTAVPNANYHFVNWSDASTSNPRTDVNVSGNITVTANFAIDTYTLTYTAGANGSITGTTPQTVNHGANGSAVTAVPVAGYHFVDWSDASTSNPRTDATVTGNISVTANFAINVYTLTYTAGANGSLTGTTPQSVNHGGSGSAVTAVPAANYHFVDWSDASTLNPRTDANVTGDVTVTANFAIDTYTLTYTAGANGSLTGTTPQTVNHGASGSAVTAVPAAGYHFVNWSDASASNPRTDAGVTGNISVTANFAINAYALTYTAGANGSITGTTPQTVNHGADGSAVTAVPAAGYHFVDWSDASTSNPRTDANVSANISVTANFAINAYTLTYTAGANGSITGTSPQTVNHGSDGTAVTAVPSANYHFVNWSDASTSNPRTDANVSGNISVTANFAIDSYTLTYTAGANGSITGTSPQTVNHGADGSAVTAVPGTGYHFVDWSDASTSNPRTDAGVTGNVSVTANFAINAYSLTYTAGANGSVTGTTPQTVNHGADGLAVTAVPAAGYHFVDWSDASTSNPRTDAAVTGNIAVTANFAIDTYTLTYTAGANGSITGTTPQTVNHGADGTAVTAVPNANYHFVNWSDASTSNPRTDAAVTGNVAVTANFAIDTYTLTYTAGANGSITGTTPQTVNHGADGSAVTAVPAAGYHFVDWSDASTSNPRTDAGVSGNISVTANFAIDTYSLTYTAGANGSITGTTPQTVNHGGSGSAVTAVPNANYHFVNWSDASTANPRTDAGVTGNISVTANFAIDAYTLTYTAGANGSLTGTTPQTVNHGGTGSAVTAVPSVGYHFVDWSDASTSNPRTDAGVTGNISVTANFAINVYTLTYTAGANGSITGTTPQTVNHGGSGSAVTALPNSGYHFVDWSDASTSNPRTDAGVTGNISVTANFAINAYTLTYTAGANGSITGTTPQTVNHGATGSAVTAVPNSGYHFVNWSDASTSNPRLDAGVTGNISVTANFAINAYTLTYTAGANGSLTGTTPQTVNHGGSGSAVTAVPNVGYHFVNWSDASTSNPRTDAVVTGNISVTANFALNVYTLTYTAGANGSVTGTTPQSVNHGGSGSAVTAVPNSGYHFVNWSDASTSNPRTDAGVTGNISVSANFAINVYTLTYTAGANGAVTGTTPQTVNHGATGSAVTAVPNSGYHFVNWSDASTSNPRTDAAVTGNISVTANFAINAYTLTYTAGANGAVTGTTPQTVNHGGSGSAVTAVPNSGYHFANWSDASTSNPRTDAAVTGNISVTANFAINAYTLTYTAGANGSITGTTPQTVNHGGSGSAVTAVPNANYQFVDWSDASTANPRTDVNVIGNITVTANFTLSQVALDSFRTARSEDWATAVDGKGKLKSVKRKADKVDAKLVFIAPSAATGFTLKFSMPFTGKIYGDLLKTVLIDSMVGVKERSVTTVVDNGDTFQLQGVGAKGKLLTLSVIWKSTPKALTVSYKTPSQFLVNQLRLPMPNLHNVGEELFPKGFGQTGPVFASGLKVGVPQGVKGANAVLHPAYKNVLASLNKKGRLHVGVPKCLSEFDAGAKFIDKLQKSLPPDKQDNKLFAEVLALRLNIGASQMSKFPNGLGELTYANSADPANPFNGQTINTILAKADTMMSCLGLASKSPVPTYADLYSVVRNVNLAFAGPVDTISFAPKTSLRGTRRAADVPYLFATPGSTPEKIEDAEIVEEALPVQYELDQNYPNPFNPTTTIRFSIPEDATVSVMVFNMLGQQVATLISEELVDAGMQEVDFDASSFASGIYFYRLTVNPIQQDDGTTSAPYVKTMKMMLVK